MRKLIILFCLGLFIFLTGCKKESVIPGKDLPAEIQSYLNTHFPSCEITKVVKGNENATSSFDIDLDCAVNLEFDRDHKVIDIDGMSKLPDSVIPPAILSYVSDNYLGKTILGWEIEALHQRIDLDNNVVLEFNSEGDFIKIVE